MKRTLLVLGAGVFQIPLILKAKELGYTACATSFLPDDPGLRICDRAFNVSTLDLDGLERLCRDERVSGVVTAASDVGTLAVGRLNDRLGLPGLTEDQVRNVTDKVAFVRLLKRLELPCPQSQSVDGLRDLDAALETVRSYPVIMKPRFASGSRGVRVCASAIEVRLNHAAVMRSSLLDPGYVLQQFLPGIEHGGECLLENGSVAFLRLTHKYHNERKVPLGHCVPYECPPTVMDSLRRQIETIAKALHVQHSAVNLDVILPPDGPPHLIDVSFRLGGNLLPHLMHQAFGTDTHERVIRYCSGEALPPLAAQREPHGCYGSIIFGGNAGGTLTKQLVVATRQLFEESSDLIDLAFDIVPGQRYEAFDQGSHRYGHALFRVDGLRAYERLLEAQRSILRDRSMS